MSAYDAKVHTYPTTGLIAKCEVCGEMQSHTCAYVNEFCKYCGEQKVYNTGVTSSNRERFGYKNIEGENLVITPATFIGDGTNGYTNGWKYMVSSISDKAFFRCELLASITIPNSVNSIGVNAFYGCSSLVTASLSNNTTNIKNGAFAYCSSLTSIAIPDSVTLIGSSAFDSCTNLTSITIGSGVTAMGGSVFKNCTSLTSVTYKGITYTSKSALETALANGGVAVGGLAFGNTGLTA